MYRQKRCGSNRKDKKDENAYSDNRDGRYGHGTERRTLSGSGEEVTADKFCMWPGGRGLLSAIAASKLGGDSLLCAAVGR